MNKENIQAVIYAINNINQNDVNLPSLNHTVEKVEEEIGFEEVFNRILEYISNKEIKKLDKLINTMTNISSRTKTKVSIESKWKKNLGKKRPLKKVLNDIVGIRIVTDENIDNIINYINKISENENYKINVIDYRKDTKSIDDGYRGIHIYFLNNPKSFRIEIQIWSILDAIINFYTHKNIYKANKDISYALSLRIWLDNLPYKKGFNFESYLWEITNNPYKYAEQIARILVENIELNKDIEEILLEHFIEVSKCHKNDPYIVKLGEHLKDIPNNSEGIEITFSEYIIKQVIEEVV